MFACSWYSWVLQSLVNGVYAFGFLFMLPQLFVNYKLKSVAHLPWRAFMYKVQPGCEIVLVFKILSFFITFPGIQHIHRRYICFHYHNADCTQSGLFPR